MARLLLARPRPALPPARIRETPIIEMPDKCIPAPYTHLVRSRLALPLLGYPNTHLEKGLKRLYPPGGMAIMNDLREERLAEIHTPEPLQCKLLSHSPLIPAGDVCPPSKSVSSNSWCASDMAAVSVACEEAFPGKNGFPFAPFSPGKACSQATVSVETARV